ncbi:MAG: CHAD domain-containing protein [Caldilineaceae bacterium]|uniref:CHAD domain-containing protein n=1 Tax=Caldilineaceae bacterium SB0675_bin_29 TaxID=2605266 RepID=A0A6B1G4W5_9CHLR|nr:CHAD domain-containing protein [Caldilineaceae bacterium]MYH63378.1 CHAD domain-containing protein [Caldilineaceae bacterium SB0675_bin_29]
MKFTLIPEEAPSDSLRRIASEQIGGAIAQLQRKDDLNEGIHEARKHFKRVRALLRLARGALPAETYAFENQFFRDLGRLLSPVRDSAVYIETLDLLRDSQRGRIADEAFLRLRKRLVREHRAVLNEFAQDEQRQGSIIDSLRYAQPRVAEWRFRQSEFSLFRAGLRRIYGRGREERAVAFSQPTTESFHAWRKRVKYLWYHLQILQPLWPAQLKAVERDCDRLADRLGEEHDLAVLLATPTVQDLLDSRSISADLLRSNVSRERERQRRAAIPLAQRIYVESPRQFVDRIEAYWLAYRPHSQFLPK